MVDNTQLENSYNQLVELLMTPNSPGDEPSKGRLGGLDQSGNYAVGVGSNYVIARSEDGKHSGFIEALNFGVPLLPDYPVLIYTTKGTEAEVQWVTADPSRVLSYVSEFGLPLNNVAYHTHEAGFGLFDYVSPIRITYGLVIAGSGLVVIIKQFFYKHNGVLVRFSETSLPIDSGIPEESGERRWGVVGIQPSTNTALLRLLTVTTSALDVNDLAGLDLVDFIPLMGLRFAYGQTGLTFADFEYCQAWGGGDSGSNGEASDISYDILDEDPDEPEQGDKWVLRSIDADASGSPIGLLLALTTTTHQYQLSIYADGAPRRVALT